MADFFSKFPNQWSDFDPTSPGMGLLADQFYEDITPEWGKASGQLGDYQKHLARSTFSGLTGHPEFGYALDYESDRARGLDSDAATEEGLENLGISAAILASIFGGSSLFGGEGGGSSVASGAEAYPTASADTLANWGLGGVDYGTSYTATPYAQSVAGATGGGGSWFDKLTQSLGDTDTSALGGGQQQGGYDSIMNNMLRLSPWTVAQRDPARLAQLLALLRSGGGQAGILGY